jgi:hypothetical protein
LYFDESDRRGRCSGRIWSLSIHSNERQKQEKQKAEWGFRTMPISVPGMPISGSALMAIMIPG